MSARSIIAGAVVLAFVTAATPAQLTAEKLFEPHHIVDVKVEIDPDDWNRLRQQTRSFTAALGKSPQKRPFTYFKGNVTVDGVRVEGVGVRKKGFIGSLSDERPSLKIKFGEYDAKSPIAGLDRLTLNNNKQDRSLISQYVGFKLFNEAGIKAPRCNLARVSVNGENLGIYSNVEAVKPPFLERAFGDGSGQLYEGTVADLFPGRLQRLEVKSGARGHAGLEELTRILASADVDVEALDEELDVELFIRFWAMESLTSFWDGYCNNQNNYFIYRPAGGRFQFIPWGADDLFTTVLPMPPYRLKHKSVLAKAVIPTRLYANEGTRARYRATLLDLMKKHWDEEAIIAELDWAKGAVAAHIHSSQDDFEKGLAKVRKFVSKRRGDIEKELEEWPIKLENEPREPIYFKVVGKGTGTFDTVWGEKAPKKPLTHGKATLEFTLDGEKITFKQLGVSSERSTWPQGPGERGPQPPAITFTGRRASDGKKVVIGFSQPIKRFHAGETAEINGVMFVGALGFMNPKGMRWLSGTATYEQAAMTKDAPVKGTVTFEMVQMVGEF